MRKWYYVSFYATGEVLGNTSAKRLRKVEKLIVKELRAYGMSTARRYWKRMEDN